MSFGVDRRDHVDLGTQIFRRDRVGLSTLAPLLATEVEMRQPSLVNVDDPLTLVQELEHLLCVQHSENEAPLRVTLESNFFYDPVTHVEVLAQDSLDFVLLDIELLLRFDGVNHLLDCPDVLLACNVLGHDADYLLVPLISVVALLLQSRNAKRS